MIKSGFIKKNAVAVIVAFVLSFILFVFHREVGIAALVISFLMFLWLYKQYKTEQADFVRYVEGMNNSFDLLAENAVFNMPFALIILDKDDHVEWYNTLFSKMIEKENLLGADIHELMPDLPIKSIRKGEKKFHTLKRGKQSYQFYANVIKDERSRIFGKTLIYALDNTEDEIIRRRFQDEKMAIILLSVDNLEEVRSNLDDYIKPMVMGQIDRIITTEIKKREGLIRKYEQDKYIAIVEKKKALEMLKDRFKVLDAIREIEEAGNIRPTLSIGMALDGDNPMDAHNKAKTALDVALGRGGDQAVVKVGEQLNFFGGKNKATEKRNKVKSRVIAHALMQLIDQSSEVFIMGHKNSDMDAFGAAIGMLSAVRWRKKPGYIVLNESNPSIANIFNAFLHHTPEFEKEIISGENALNKISESSLVIVVDTHRQSSTEEPRLLDKTLKVVLIDHHRRGAEYIENPTITYLEPYASSACELVTEVLSYMSESSFLSPLEAEALLAGITMDTKNFFYQTGVRTFEAASILKRVGADSMKVKNLFKDGYETYMAKAEAMKNVVIYGNSIAISHVDQETKDGVLIASEAADDFLNIRGVEASFVLTKANGKVHISGRSVGRISVQLIMERLGGGGHLTSAATQIEGMTLEEAEKTLKVTIKEFKEEGKS